MNESEREMRAMIQRLLPELNRIVGLMGIEGEGIEELAKENQMLKEYIQKEEGKMLHNDGLGNKQDGQLILHNI